MAKYSEEDYYLKSDSKIPVRWTPPEVVKYIIFYI